MKDHSQGLDTGPRIADIDDAKVLIQESIDSFKKSLDRLVSKVREYLENETSRM